MTLIRSGNKQKIQVAEETPFDNSVANFDNNPESVQAALEEAGDKGQLALDTPRYTILLQHRSGRRNRRKRWH